MEQSKVDLFIATNSDKFCNDKLLLVREKLATMSDDKFMIIQSINYQNPTTMLIISIFLGSLGIDRFVLGDTGLGILKLLTCGGCGIWAIIDWFLIMDKTKEQNFNKFMQFCN